MGTTRQSDEPVGAIREDRVREVRDRLAKGVYETRAVRDELALRLASILGDVLSRKDPELPRGDG